MFNLFEIMRNAQGGAAIDNMARQFGLTREQAQAAIDALLPAFALSLQRNAMNPNAIPQLFGLLGSGRHAGFFDNPGQAFSPQAQVQGNDVLAQLFGSKEVSRQVASQAAAMTGLGAEIFKQMLPYIAAMLVGGLFRSASSQGLGGVFGQMMDMMRGGQPANPGMGSPMGGQTGGQTAGPFGFPTGGPTAGPPGGFTGPLGPWGEILSNIFGGTLGQGAPRGQPGGYDAGPPPGPRSAAPGSFEESIGSLLDGGRRAGSPDPSPQGARRGEAPQAPPSPAPDPADLWGQVFQTGRDVQQQHLNNLQTIFDTFWGGRRPPR